MELVYEFLMQPNGEYLLAFWLCVVSSAVLRSCLTATMSTNPNHSSLRTKFRGLVEESHGVSICHYRGIQYGKIRTRYAAPEPVDCWNGEEINAQEFG